MTLYKYRASDDAGETIEDTMEEASAHRVTKKLQERGLTVFSVEESHPQRGLLRVSEQLTWDELHMLTEQLEAVARSEFPLAPALRSLSADLRSSRLKPVLERMHRELDKGATLEEAIAKNHESFPRLYPVLVRAGEATGNLAGVLQLMAGYTGRMVGLKNAFQMALAYPMAVLVLAVLVMGFMLTKVVPVFAEIFTEFGGSLPAPTRLLVKMSDLAVFRWPEACIGLCAVSVLGVFCYRQMRRSVSGQNWLDAIRLHVPLVGRLHYVIATARFARTLALLLAARVPILESLELAGAVSGSAQLERAVEAAGLQVAGGERIADSLASTGFFGHHFCWLLSTGEARGHAEEALDNLAAALEREAATRDRALSVLLGPVIIVGLALTVAFMVIALYLPIFTLGDTISGT